MGQRSKDAAVKGARVNLRKEECAGGMRQRPINVAVKDAPIKPDVEESVVDMVEQGPRNAAVKDAPIKPDVEDCALDMGQRSSGAPVKDAPTKLRGEECAKGMEQVALSPTRPLLLDQNMRRLLQL
eukprot:scaffold7856_cov72-Skeletonema_dohrnii-CCMP3373.AAC.3